MKTVRLTTDGLKKIKKKFGTVQNSMDMLVEALKDGDTMKTLFMTAMVLSVSTAMAFDGGMEIVKKDDLIGGAFKAEILRVEYLEGKSKTTQNDSAMARTDKTTEVNVSVEPDFEIISHNSLSVEISPLVGVSSKKVTTLNQDKVDKPGIICKDTGVNGFVPDGKCFSYSKKNSAAFNHGASLKFNVQADKQIQLYLKAGAYSNESNINYKPQFAVGFSAPW